MSKVHWVIPCPICGKRLRVVEQSMLGRRGQCPSCRHKFTLELPRTNGFVRKHAESDFDILIAAPEETLKLDSDYASPAEDDGTHLA
ncbi:MAG: hypothetical protein HON53_19300 [Planctomycetaceae bacterium]|jgi:DNA-directed RNA polymerase subunit RPC12/RpoP|nr:hypothetical protein [Planctomycetaceae bacterium]MBT6155052.1 hypothetical protein [Planctomycetaceae bacterium]MBT6486133.1 hypothetical protein [Planctomycetaceae bacterium]MBT6495236.1 hypothetical protein [Planctomycetaceae bacterium]